MAFENYSFGLGSDAGAALGGQFEQTRGQVMAGGPLSSKLDYYAALGQQLRSALEGTQQQQQPQQQPMAGPQPEGYQPNLTSGFDMNWLAKQTSAGSADGKGI